MKIKSSKHLKLCGYCGEECLTYSVVQNMPVCKDCKPIEKKKIPNESTMLKSLLNAKIKENSYETQQQIIISEDYEDDSS